MIEINLVPENLRKKWKPQSSTSGQGAFPMGALISLGAGVLVVLLLVHVVLQLVIASKITTHKSYQHQWDAVVSDKTNVDKVIQELKQTRER